jgi:hypothetical protein
MKEPKITFHVLREEHTYRCIAEQVQHYLEEKLLVVGKGARYGQVIMLAGGAGSGKGFTISNYLEGEKFKVFNPDDLKDMFVKMNGKLRDKTLSHDIKKRRVETASSKTKTILRYLWDLDLRNPEDVFKMHTLFVGMNTQQKQLALFFKNRGTSAGTVDTDTLPNIIFDNTLKDTTFLLGEKGQGGILHTLKDVGYKPENIHVVWVLTDFKCAIKQNLTRGRVVPSKVLFATHRGVAATMKDIIFKNFGALGINGDIAVVIGGKSTIVQKAGDTWTDPKTGKVHTLERDIKAPISIGWEYFRIKRQGSTDIDGAALEKIHQKIVQSAPSLESVYTSKIQDDAVASLRAQGKMDKTLAARLGYKTDKRDIEYKDKTTKHHTNRFKSYDQAAAAHFMTPSQRDRKAAEDIAKAARANKRL